MLLRHDFLQTVQLNPSILEYLHTYSTERHSTSLPHEPPREPRQTGHGPLSTSVAAAARPPTPPTSRRSSDSSPPRPRRNSDSRAPASASRCRLAPWSEGVAPDGRSEGTDEGRSQAAAPAHETAQEPASDLNDSTSPRHLDNTSRAPAASSAAAAAAAAAATSAAVTSPSTTDDAALLPSSRGQPTSFRGVNPQSQPAARNGRGHPAAVSRFSRLSFRSGFSRRVSAEEPAPRESCSSRYGSARVTERGSFVEAECGDLPAEAPVKGTGAAGGVGGGASCTLHFGTAPRPRRNSTTNDPLFSIDTHMQHTCMHTQSPESGVGGEPRPVLPHGASDSTNPLS